jgi:cell division protein FtsL
MTTFGSEAKMTRKTNRPVANKITQNLGSLIKDSSSSLIDINLVLFSMIVICSIGFVLRQKPTKVFSKKLPKLLKKYPKNQHFQHIFLIDNFKFRQNQIFFNICLIKFGPLKINAE